MKRFRLFDWVLLFVFLFGVWPFANPDHHGDAILSRVDIIVHVVALFLLVDRWVDHEREWSKRRWP
jgi:hypothetical protein